MMLVRCYLVGFPPGDEVGNVVRPEVFFDGKDSFQCRDKLVVGLNFLFRMQAVIAVSAVFLVIFLTEVVQQHLSAAYGSLGISGCLLQQLAADVLLSHRFALHELVEFLEVLVRVERNAPAFSSVSSGPSGLLVISFKALRDVVMHHEPHVGLVYSHSERNRSHYHVYLFHQKVVLCL